MAVVKEGHKKYLEVLRMCRDVSRDWLQFDESWPLPEVLIVVRWHKPCNLPQEDSYLVGLRAALEPRVMWLGPYGGSLTIGELKADGAYWRYLG